MIDGKSREEQSSKNDLKDLLAERYRELRDNLPGEEGKNSTPCPTSLNDSQLELLIGYLQLIEQWTKRIDLVSPASSSVLLERHIVDSLAAGLMLQRHATVTEGLSYVDIGSGAGLPGVVLAAIERERKVVLCEPREKRFIFLKETKRLLNLDNVFPLRQRIEQLQAENLHFPGLIVVRAFGKRELLLGNARRLLSFGGYVAELLGPSETGEWALKGELDGLRLAGNIPYSLGPGGARRRLVLWQCFT